MITSEHLNKPLRVVCTREAEAMSEAEFEELLESSSTHQVILVGFDENTQKTQSCVVLPLSVLEGLLSGKRNVDAFRDGVLRRDGHTCVMCGAPAVDAYHILDRKLYPCGGYHQNSGTSLCSVCHVTCSETTALSDLGFKGTS